MYNVTVGHYRISTIAVEKQYFTLQQAMQALRASKVIDSYILSLTSALDGGGGGDNARPPPFYAQIRKRGLALGPVGKGTKNMAPPGPRGPLLGGKISFPREKVFFENPPRLSFKLIPRFSPPPPHTRLSLLIF